MPEAEMPSKPFGSPESLGLGGEATATTPRRLPGRSLFTNVFMMILI